MSEIVNTYPAHNPHQLVPMNRNEFYEKHVEETPQKGQPDTFVEIVQIIIFNERGEMICQKRSKNKKHNPNLIDKSLGGHIVTGDSPHHTAMVETVQELMTPSLVLNDRIDFLKTYKTLGDYLHTIALLQFIESRDAIIDNHFPEGTIPTGKRMHTYFGVYAGNLKNVDAEAKGILFYELDDLAEEMEKFPEMFTPDMHYYMEHYRDRMEEFLEVLNQ